MDLLEKRRRLTYYWMLTSTLSEEQMPLLEPRLSTLEWTGREEEA